jgi:diacylglycerol kinase (ATP)
MKQEKFSLRKRAGSFRFAFDGLLQFFRTQHNALIHLAATIAVVVLSVFVHLPLSKFLFIVIAAGLVWMAELFNTAIEKLCDMVHPEQHPQIKFIKDVSAAAVLVTAIVAIVTGCIIFIPVLL